MSNYEYLLSDINKINGIGTKTAKLFRKKNINTIFDLLWNLPRDIIDRSDLRKINQLQINMAGVPGFEPGNAGIKIRCLTTWLHPRRLFKKCGVVIDASSNQAA